MRITDIQITKIKGDPELIASLPLATITALAEQVIVKAVEAATR